MVDASTPTFSSAFGATFGLLVWFQTSQTLVTAITTIAKV